MLKNKEKKGFTLLLAVLVSSIAFSIGIAVFNISLKEIRLSSSARESQFALYASDTGIDCALYWDLRGVGSQIFPTSTQSVNSSTMNCAGLNITSTSNPINWTTQKSINSATTTFTLQFANNSCVDVEVAKNFNIFQETKITSRGHNTCDTSSNRRVERAIRVSY